MRQFAIIGLDELGIITATTLARNGFDVLAIDKDINRVEEIKGEVTRTVQVDSADEDSMTELNIKDIEIAVVNLLDDFETAVLTIVILRNIGIKEIIATAQNEIKGKILNLAGATKIIYPQKEIGLKIAKTLMTPSLIDINSLSSDHSLSQVRIPKKFIGKTLSEINLRSNYKLNVVGIKKLNKNIQNNETIEDINYLPMGDDILKKDDILIIVGSDEDIEKVSNLD